MTRGWQACVATLLLSVAGVAAAQFVDPAKPDPRRSYYQQLSTLRADVFERQNSKEDILRGCTTYSVADGQQYVAYIQLRWGDLDRQLMGSAGRYYRNWDGFLTVDGGSAEVVVRAPDYSNVSPSVKSSSTAIPPETTVTQKGASRVEWRAGSSGNQGGVIVKLTLRGPQASGVFKAGNFTLNYKILPAPPKAPKEDAKTGTKTSADPKPAADEK